MAPGARERKIRLTGCHCPALAAGPQRRKARQRARGNLFTGLYRWILRPGGEGARWKGCRPFADMREEGKRRRTGSPGNAAAIMAASLERPARPGRQPDGGRNPQGARPERPCPRGPVKPASKWSRRREAAA